MSIKGVGPFTVCLVEEIVLCSMKIHDVEEEMSENQGSIYIYVLVYIYLVPRTLY